MSSDTLDDELLRGVDPLPVAGALAVVPRRLAVPRATALRRVPGAAPDLEQHGARVYDDMYVD